MANQQQVNTRVLNLDSVCEAVRSAVEGDHTHDTPAGRARLDQSIAMMRAGMSADSNLRQTDTTQVVNEMRKCLRWGLTPDGDLAIMTCYKGKFKIMPGKRGVQMRACAAIPGLSINYGAVYKGEECKIVNGSNPSLDHTIDMDVERSDDTLKACYAVARDENGKTLAFSIRYAAWLLEARAAKKRGQQNKELSGGWDKHLSEVGINSAIRNVCKHLPLPSEVALMIDESADPEEQIYEPAEIGLPENPPESGDDAGVPAQTPVQATEGRPQPDQDEAGGVAAQAPQGKAPRPF